MKSILKRIYHRCFLKPVSILITSSSGGGNISIARQAVATRETALYVNEFMSHVSSVDSSRRVHDIAMKEISIKNGMILEFGVFSGNTINYISETLQSSVVDGFDSFEGLPEFWRDGFDKGVFAIDGLPSVNSNVRLHKGWFDDTLPAFLRNGCADQKIAYLHVDCDLYSSTVTIFKLLRERIVSGTIIVFDEYFNYPGWQDGEFKAFKEFIENSGLKYDYLTYNHLHEQVAVRII
jgi:hypothetical protein